MNTKTTVLIVLDGWGYREDPTHNAVAAAKTPNFDRLWKGYSHTLLEASGLAVGLPEGQMGNSEIGHTTIGSGSIMDTDLVRIAKAIKNGDFAKNPAFQKLFAHVKKNESKIHTMGLLSDGGVHSHQDHLFAFLQLCKDEGFKKDQVVLHVFTDGRDTPPDTATKYLANLEQMLQKIGVGVIGTFGGRYFGMDRAGNWDRIAQVEEAMFKSKGNVYDHLQYPSLGDFMKEQYKKDPTGKTDEYMQHYVYRHEGGVTYPIEKKDGIFFFNFRADRARQLTEKILARNPDMNLFFVSMTQYGDTMDTTIAFLPEKIQSTLAKEISESGFSQAHISESEKFPHVTFFFNGCSDVKYAEEVHIKVNSRTDIASHDLGPEMMSKEITDKAIEQVENGTNFIVINYPNPDVVGHTGNVPAIIKAVEVVDREFGRLVDAIVEKGGEVFVTADHGNAETNVDPITGEKHMNHTINPVPAIMVSSKSVFKSNRVAPALAVTGTLADIAPTILALMGIPKPKAMKGKSLV